MKENEIHECYITREYLIEALDDNREIEFSLQNRIYFATPRTNPPSPSCYAVLDSLECKWIFEGSIAELFSFSFPGGFTLNENFGDFDILYIL